MREPGSRHSHQPHQPAGSGSKRRLQFIMSAATLTPPHSPFESKGNHQHSPPNSSKPLKTGSIPSNPRNMYVNKTHVSKRGAHDVTNMFQKRVRKAGALSAAGSPLRAPGSRPSLRMCDPSSAFHSFPGAQCRSHNDE